MENFEVLSQRLQLATGWSFEVRIIQINYLKFLKFSYTHFRYFCVLLFFKLMKFKCFIQFLLVKIVTLQQTLPTHKPVIYKY